MTSDLQAAMADYLRLGWTVAEHDGRLELVTGGVIDALEVPRAAGVLAVSWWLYSEGQPDKARGLPSLPDPRHAMAVIAAGDRYFFLALAGTCPWRAGDPSTTAVAGSAIDAAAIRWHSQGSRIPAPSIGPGRTGDGGQAAWAHLPGLGVRLASPAILLHLLATAAATARHGPHVLALPGGVHAIPALGGGQAGAPGVPPRVDESAVRLARAPTPFGFGGSRTRTTS